MGPARSSGRDIIFPMKRHQLVLHDRHKREAWEQARFWAAHAGHWTALLGFLIVTFSLLYTLWGNDAAFAATFFGR